MEDIADENPTYGGSNLASNEMNEQILVNEGYKTWKKNSAFLYDQIFTRSLEWPTLTTQWFPDVKSSPDSNTDQHRILFGTHTSGQARNYLQIATLDVPKPTRASASEMSELAPEIGGHGAATADFAMNVVQRINHPGEINKARYQPQNPNIIATTGIEGRVLIFDRTKHLTQPKDDSFQIELELVGHTKEGFGLSWNPFQEGQLATGCQDGTVRLWDLRHGFSPRGKEAAYSATSSFPNTPAINSYSTWNHHSAIVNDVQHHPLHRHWIGTVSDDSTMQIIDTRTNAKDNAIVRDPDESAPNLNCLAFHPQWSSIVLTGNEKSKIHMWDLRQLSRPVHYFDAHSAGIVKVEWHPSRPAIFASASEDHRLGIWNAARIGAEMSEEELQDGPAELLFMHGGFVNPVCDFNWNKNDPWLLTGASEDNQLHFFKPSSYIVDSSTTTTAQMQDVQK